MTGIQLTGLASGLDTESIISQLMAVERQPRTRLALSQTQTQTRQDALKDVQAKLILLKTAATGLRSVTTWSALQEAETSDPTKATARTLSGAAPGGHTLAVTALARAAQSTYTFTTPGADGTFAVNGTSIPLAAGATLADAVAAINSSDTAGVYAVDVGGRLAISAKTTGAASAATATGGALSAGTTLAGADAAFSLDGTSYTRASNLVSDVLPGVELTLKGITDGLTVNVSPPGADPDAVVSRVKAFVDAYNTTVDAVRSRTTEKRVPDAATTADAVKGVLFGDSGLESTLASLRIGVGAPVTGMPAGLDQLSSLGISTGAASGASSFSPDAVAGKLTLDETALRAKLASDPSGVQKLLGGTTGTSGFAQAFEATLDPMVQTGGTFDGRVSAADSQLKSIADSLTTFDDRMSLKEANLRKRFTVLETALQRNQDTLARVKAQFG